MNLSLTIHGHLLKYDWLRKTLYNEREDLQKILDEFKKGGYGGITSNSTKKVRSEITTLMDVLINKYTQAQPVDKTALCEILYLLNKNLPEMYKVLGQRPYKDGLKDVIDSLEQRRRNIIQQL